MPNRWTIAAAREIARSIGIEEISVWIYDEEHLRKLSGSSHGAPTSLELGKLEKTGRLLGRPADTLMPIVGMSGQLYGTVVIPAPLVSLSGTDLTLMESFARHLGGALELQKARKALAKANLRKKRDQKELVSQGFSILKICPQCKRCFDHKASHCADDGAELATPPAFPFRINKRYRLSRVLGQGGMGMVFGAVDERLERRVAIKVIRAESVHDRDCAPGFERESIALTRIQHPGGH